MVQYSPDQLWRMRRCNCGYGRVRRRLEETSVVLFLLPGVPVLLNASIDAFAGELLDGLQQAFQDSLAQRLQ